MELWSKKSLLPWEIHQALKPEYLIRSASILRRARDSAARHAKRSLGDDLWTIGCTAYRRGVHAMGMAAAEEYGEWLSTCYMEHIHFIKIKGIPLRHYRGFDDDEVPEKFCRESEVENVALSLAFIGREGAPGYLRFEISTTPKGFTKDIRFVVVGRGNEILHPWTIPQFEHTSKRAGAVRLPRAGVIPSEKKGDQAR